jgi:PIN domain nuclease of toxin-antitoxin system
MKILLDSHAFLWFVLGDKRLSLPARLAIEDLNNQRLISIASLWEIAIKFSKGRMQFTEPFELLIPRELQQNRIEILGVELSHVERLVQMPFHHNDPFDRIIIAQSLVEHIPIVSTDIEFSQYSVQIIW